MFPFYAVADSVETFSIPVSITWEDYENQDGVRPASVKLELVSGSHVLAAEDIKGGMNAKEWNGNISVPQEALDGVDPSALKIVQKGAEAYTSDFVSQPSYDLSYDLEKIEQLKTTDFTVDNGYVLYVRNDSKGYVWSHKQLAKEIRDCFPSYTFGYGNGHFHINGNCIYADGSHVYFGSSHRWTYAEIAAVRQKISIEGSLEIRNSHVPEIIPLKGSIRWNDDEDAYGNRPAEVTVDLFADGCRIASRTISKEQNWKWDFGELPAYAHGKAIAYAVKQKDVEGYVTRLDDGILINTLKKTEVTGSVIFEDEISEDSERPDSITVDLLADGKVIDTKEITAGNSWAWNFDELPQYVNGKKVTYAIEKREVPGYSMEMDGDVLICRTKTTKLSGTVAWDDTDNAYGNRPKEIRILVYDGDVPVASQIVTGEDGWTYVFHNLPKYRDGKTISYSIMQEDIAGYEWKTQGNDVRNTAKNISVSGSIAWQDQDDAYGNRPSSVEIKLYDGSKLIETKNVTAKNGWKYSFKDLPGYRNGKAISYSVQERVAGYDTSIRGFQIVNNAEKTAVDGNVSWMDEENAYENRPSSVKISVYDGNLKVAEQLVSEKMNWSYSFADLPKYRNQKEISYSIQAAPVRGYALSQKGNAAIYSLKTMALTGKVNWEDEDNAYGNRPSGITAVLYEGSREIERQTVSGDSWMWCFSDLPSYVDGRKASYRVEILDVPCYVKVSGAHDVTFLPELTDVKGKIIWLDGNNARNVRPASVDLTLMEGKTSIRKQKASGNAFTFTDVPKYRNGEVIIYSVKEGDVAGYVSKVTGLEVRNIEMSDTSFGSVVWKDNDNRKGTRPEQVTAELYINGAASGQTAAADEAGGWTFTFPSVPMYEENGSPISYALKEIEIPEGYAVSYETNGNGDTVITNTFEDTEMDISVLVCWNDHENRYDSRPKTVSIELQADGDVTETAEITSEDDWTCTFKDLPRTDENGNEIKYTVSERKIGHYNTSVSGSAEGGYVIMNTYTLVSADVIVILSVIAVSMLLLLLFIFVL